MRDFPLSGLLSATDTEAIRVAIIDIFAHLKKMRGTRYPVVRATKLIQTLSRDLSDQLLRVLGGQGLMNVRYHFSLLHFLLAAVCCLTPVAQT